MNSFYLCIVAILLIKPVHSMSMQQEEITVEETINLLLDAAESKAENQTTPTISCWKSWTAPMPPGNCSKIGWMGTLLTLAQCTVGIGWLLAGSAKTLAPSVGVIVSSPVYFVIGRFLSRE